MIKNKAKRERTTTIFLQIFGGPITYCPGVHKQFDENINNNACRREGTIEKQLITLGQPKRNSTLEQELGYKSFTIC